MSINPSTDIFWRSAAENSDLGTNGGRITSTVIPDGVKNSIFPNVSEAQRIAGLTRYRKVGIHIANDADLALMDGKVFVQTPTPGGDSITFFPATPTDTQSDLSGSERVYGAGTLFAPINVGASTIEVATEGAALDMFRDGDTIRISDKADVSAGTGNEEFHVISGAPVYDGDKATITIAGTLAYGYSDADTVVSSVMPLMEPVKAHVDNILVTSPSGGGFSGEIQGDGIGSVDETITLAFTSPTDFDISGSYSGNLGAGSTATDTAPNNIRFNKPLFVIPSAGFTGSFNTGDTITFDVHSAHIFLWYKLTVPAGVGSLDGNVFSLGIAGESE